MQKNLAVEHFLETRPILISVAREKLSENQFPTKFEGSILDKLEDLESIFKGDHCYSISIFKDNGHRRQENFVSASGIILDMDSGGKVYSLEKMAAKFRKEKIVASFVTSKSHQKVKGKEKATDRYHVLIPLSDEITTKEAYQSTAKALSLKFFNAKDDSACHEAARLFFPSPKEAQIIHVYGSEFNFFEPVETSSAITTKLNRVKHTLSSQNITKDDLNFYQEFLNKNDKSKAFSISHYNDSNGTLNLHRDENDINAGCFMFNDSNKIFDNVGNRVANTDFSLNQVLTAKSNLNIPIESLREKLQSEILASIDTEKNYNIILTSEGLGKSKLVPKFKAIFGEDRAVLVCKSYEQLFDKRKMFKKYNPELLVEIIPGIERLLNKYNISERVYLIDKETGERYLSFSKSVEQSDVEGEIKRACLIEKQYLDNLIDGKVKVDIILMTEDKLRIEVLIKKNFRKEGLTIFDEFNTNLWFQYRTATDIEIAKDKIGRLVGQEIIYQETWEGYITKMIKEKNDWTSFMLGKKIILSTENKVTEFFKSHDSINFIDKRTTFFTSDNVTIRSVKSGLLNAKNKRTVNAAFLENQYITIGNGISSKLNNVSVLGQNYHDEFENQKITILSTSPCPEELAELMINLKLSSDEATTLKMSDTLNQTMGRCQGFRDNVKIKSMEILIPDNLINNLLPLLRYINPIVRTFDKEDSIVDRILHTLYVDILGIKINTTLYLGSLAKRVNIFIEGLINNFNEIKNKYIGLTYYNIRAYFKNRNKTVIEIQKEFLQHMRGRTKSTLALYSNFIQQFVQTTADRDMESIMQNSLIRV